MFKYKDVRMFLLACVLLVGCIVSFFTYHHDKFKLVATIFLTMSLLSTIAMQFNNSIFEDGLVIHCFKKVAILPVIIDFKDIKECKKVGRYKIEVLSDKKYVTYTTNASKFIIEFEEKYQAYRSK